ncbi:MAG: cupin [Flavobacteriales bacterium]|jgi:quercetin dioxygenase-like cupin family protein|nr:cupin [Flavobacteriales bacterium]
MKVSNILQSVEFNAHKPNITVLLNTDFTKEIRIALDENQSMKEHSTPFPIVVEIVEGSITFGVQGNKKRLLKGDLIALEGGIPHDLVAHTRSIIRLTLSKADQSERVKKVIE